MVFCLIFHSCMTLFSSYGSVIELSNSLWYAFNMTYIKSWEEFEKAGERLYLQNPLKARYTMKYVHRDGQLYLKLTDDVRCLQYKTEIIQDLKKIEKFVGNLMKHMASKETN